MERAICQVHPYPASVPADLSHLVLDYGHACSQQPSEGLFSDLRWTAKRHQRDPLRISTEEERLAGGARPVRADAMVEAGTIDQELYDALPEVSGTPVIPTNEQTEKMAAYLADNWAKAVG